MRRMMPPFVVLCLCLCSCVCSSALIVCLLCVWSSDGLFSWLVLCCVVLNAIH